jgi:hypothetical protein
MNRIALVLGAVAMAAVVAAASRPATGADAEPAPQRAKAVRGASPDIDSKDEPAPKLLVAVPLPEGRAIGVVWMQYRVENVRIVPVFGEGAATVSPRVRYLPITVDDLPWWLALNWPRPTTTSSPDSPRR